MNAILLKGAWRPCISPNKWLRATDVVQLPHFVGEVKEAQRALGNCPAVKPSVPRPAATCTRGSSRGPHLSSRLPARAGGMSANVLLLLQGAGDHCYYQGRLRGNPHSFAALSTCQGLQ